MPTIQENRSWNDYSWPKDGEEWSGQASFCGQPYPEWKQSIADNFIYPYVNQVATVLEIAPGHGRWTEFIVPRCQNLILVDLNQKCIEFCKKRFQSAKNITYYVNDGQDLSFIPANSVDFIFSYDSFAHMDKETIGAYVKEFSRILKKDGVAIIHHAGRRHYVLWLAFIHRLGGVLGRKIYNFISLNRFDSTGGWRSNISKERIKKMATRNNLTVKYQIDSWGKDNQYNVKLSNDYITKLVKNK